MGFDEDGEVVRPFSHIASWNNKPYNWLAACFPVDETTESDGRRRSVRYLEKGEREEMGGNEKEVIASALAKHLGISLGEISSGLEASDIKTLYSTLLKSSGKWSPQKESDEVMKWIAFVESFPVDSSKSCFAALAQFNEDLLTKSVVLGNGFTPSEADIIVFAVVHSSVIGLSNPEREKLQNVLRWMSYIQNREDFGELFEKILVEKPDFDFGTPLRYLMSLQQSKDLSKLEADSNSKKTTQIIKETDKSKEDLNVKENAAKGKISGTQESNKEKKKQPEAEVVEKDKELSVSLLNIQVGLIRKAWKHPSADSLLVEEIDVGDAKLRQVVSGLAKYYSPDELMNRRVVLITNVKPGKLRDVMSEGLVLCASNEDHTAVEPLLPPLGAKIGERVSFYGNDGKPEDVLNPKKKQLEKITPNLFTDDKGVATFKGIPFMTSGGPCTSSLPKASIK